MNRSFADLSPGDIDKLKKNIDWDPVMMRASLLLLVSIVHVVTVVLLIRRRDMYPIRQSSPLLLTLSIIGNFTCIICGYACITYFNFFVQL